MRGKPYSLRSRLLFYVVLVACFVFLFTELIIVDTSYRALIKVSNQTLEAYALSLASLVEVERDGRVDFDASGTIMPDSTGRNPRTYFLIIRASDNSEIARSDSLQGANLSLPRALEEIRPGKKTYWQSYINGKRIRFLGLRKFSQSEDEPADAEESGASPDTALSASTRKSHPARPVEEFLFVVGANNHDIRERMENTVGVTGPALGAGLVVMILLSWVVISRSLEPLHRLDREVQPISASNMAPVTVPEAREVANFAQTLNRVIGNLRNAFERERRFTSNVAHELRTPISEVRSLSEVALKCEENLSENNRRNYEDILASAIEMQKTVSNLLTLARRTSGNLKTGKDAVELKPFITAISKEFAGVATDKNIKVTSEAPSDLSIITDSNFLKVILQNLFSNAVTYTPEGGAIGWKLDVTENEFVISISNSVKDLSDGDLNFLFEPFWRKDETRTPGSDHNGLGLALVQSLSSALGLRVSPHLENSSLFTITLAGQKTQPPRSFSS